jgi:predicted nucleotidyltransferase component of viral defense system
MKEFLNLTKLQQEQAINATAARKKIDPFMVEKDFWIVLFLNLLFHKSAIGSSFAFKGGTSLSKAYHAINRFSEDIDLIIDWRVLGYEVDEPWEKRSKTQQNKFNTEADQRAHDYIASTVLPELERVVRDEGIAGVELSIREDEPETIDIMYPRLFSSSYSLQSIRLEIGPLAAWTPATNQEVQSYISEEFPQIFTDATTSIPTVEAKRTFWEKVVILHREANRGKTSLAYRYSRHYYDVYMLSLTEVKQEALSELGLLHDVVAFNQQFYPIGAAKFEEAVPDTIRLMPTAEQLVGLRKDYEAMSVMFFGEPVTFDIVMAGIKYLEDEIHQLTN